jgi:FAD:protein FMN transferase
MASPCEVHIELRSRKRARQLLELACREAWRIERLFSRYRDDNIVHRINTSGGKPVVVDAETARLLDFANECFELSDGLFDVTSGVLRKAWHFDGSDRVPGRAQVEALLEHIGWQHTRWENPAFTLPVGMQIDFGGIGKEYAVDRTVAILREHCSNAFMVNYGGDLHAAAPPLSSGAWSVGIEAVCRPSAARPIAARPNAAQPNAAQPIAAQPTEALKTVQLHRGALTTSGDARRYLLRDGVRYGHVLNPLTGWPVENAPASVTVAGNTCIEAGVLSTLAILQGANAETFLDEQGVTYWCQRG